MATGDTLPAFEFGGGIEVDTGGRTFFRADFTDRILKYPGPTIDSDFEVRDEGFYGHALRIDLRRRHSLLAVARLPVTRASSQTKAGPLSGVSLCSARIGLAILR